MKTSSGYLSLGLLTLSLVAGASFAQAGTLPDSTITSKLLALLGGHDQAYKGVDACVKDGSVTMSGKVASEELKNKAADFAKSIPSVKEIINNIDVR